VLNFGGIVVWYMDYRTENKKMVLWPLGGFLFVCVFSFLFFSFFIILLYCEKVSVFEKKEMAS